MCSYLIGLFTHWFCHLFFIPLTEQTNLLYESVQLSWFNPSQQLSTTQPLAHSSLPPPVGWGGESKTSETRGLR